MKRKKQLMIVITIVMLSIIGFEGCTEEETSTIIEIEIESFYSFETEGNFTVDGIRIQNFSIDIFSTQTFVVNKSILPEQQYHNVTIYAKSGDQLANTSCDQVTKSVKFAISVNFKLSCLNFE